MSAMDKTTESISVHPAKDVAEYFLTLSDPYEGDVITNLKLQKLCYYAQGFALVVLGRPLFSQDVLAWAHGPVVEDVYHAYKQYQAQAIPVPKEFDFDLFTPEERELLDEVWNVYGQFSAWKLRNMTHEEPPTMNTSQDKVISHDALRAYFRTQVKG